MQEQCHFKADDVSFEYSLNCFVDYRSRGITTQEVLPHAPVCISCYCYDSIWLPHNVLAVPQIHIVHWMIDNKLKLNGDKLLCHQHIG